MLTGVNYAGAEFGTGALPGVMGEDYIYPTNSQLQHFIDKKLATFRLPCRWERVQRKLGGELDKDELAEIKRVVKYCTDQGANVILDVHNYGRYGSLYIQPCSNRPTAGVTAAHFVDLWVRLANEFRANPRVIFGLMNEPMQHSGPEWRGIVDAAMAGIRGTGADNLVLVPGRAWTGAHSWMGANAPHFEDFNDINYAFEVHQYFDSDSSGRSPATGPTAGSDRVKAFTDWCRARGARGWLGEFGAYNNSTDLAALDDILAYMKANSDVWLGWSYWAAGAWWGNYYFSVEPPDKPQTAVLVKYAVDEPVPEPPPEEPPVEEPPPEEPPAEEPPAEEPPPEEPPAEEPPPTPEPTGRVKVSLSVVVDTATAEAKVVRVVSEKV